MNRFERRSTGSVMASRKAKSVATICALLLAATTVACGDEPRAATRGVGPARPGGAAAAAAASPSAAAASDSTTGDGGTGDASRPPALTVTDNDFNESDRTRDPFRNFAREFVPVVQHDVVDETTIKLRNYGLDELRLVAVITGTESPYAMVVDTTGKGTIVRRGEYVGRPEMIGGGTDGTVPHQAPWRLARIVPGRVRRDGDNNLTEIPAEIVFEREDRLNPNAPRAERSLTLNPAVSAAVAAAGENPTAAPLPLPSAPGMGSPFLPTLPQAGPGAAGAGRPGAPAGLPPGVVVTQPSAVPGQPGVTVQQYTQILPPQQPAAPPPTTITIQQAPPSQPSQPTLAPLPNTPPPVMINGSGAQPLPVAGLPR